MYGPDRIVRRTPTAIIHFWTDKVDILIEIPRIVLTTFQVILIILRLSHFLRHQSNTPVIGGVFHRDRSSLTYLITRDITFFQHIRYPILLLINRGSYHIAIRTIGIKAGKTFQIGIRDNRHSAISRHLVRLATNQWPDRQFVLLVVNTQHRVHQIRHILRLDNREQEKVE